MSATIGKVLTGLATVGSIGGAGAVTYFALNNTQDISGRLKEEGFTLLDLKEKEGDWAPVLKAYKVASTNTFTGSLDANATEDYLKNKCKEALGSKFDNDKNYRLAKQWCVKEESIETILGRRKYKILDTTDSKKDDDTDWTTKITELLKDTTKFKAVETTVKQQDIAENIKAIKEGCAKVDIKTIKTTATNFAENIDLAQKWCAVKINK